ncbi:MAG: GYD domain-containing protein, partial [Dehalococcoidia bacterium]|nr:GYD domain-containing protein [Dehalococcoidia bacterium]
MPTYINFLSFTEQGVKTIKDLPARIAAGRQAIEANGGKLLNYYLTMDGQDAVIVLEARDDETVTSIALAT